MNPTRFSLLFAAIPFLFVSLPSGAQSPLANGVRLVTDNTPKMVASAKNLGPENPLATIDVTVWLTLHNRGELDLLAKELYDRNSPKFRAWLSKSDFVARFAPTAQEAEIVKEFFTAHHLHVTEVGPDNFFVRARGTVAAAQSAFHVNIARFEVNGATRRSNTSDPSLEGPAGSLVQAVYGLDNMEFKHPLVSQMSALPRHTSQAVAADLVAAQADPDFFTSNCFTGPNTQTYSSAGSYPIATYTGNTYNGTQNIFGCGYTPPEIYTAYNLNGLYAEGFDGSGQTIVIVDWCGSPTITDDANAFSARFGLPVLDSSNFNIIPVPGPSTCASVDPEVNIDVEWAHAIAPGAHIDLVVPATASIQDVDAALVYAVLNDLGNVISGSYGTEEYYTSPSVVSTENTINESAAVMGISANYASGDSGDFTFNVGPPLIPASVSAPADSPYATAVGGVSLALNPDNTLAFQTGWGTNQTLILDNGAVIDPPVDLGFRFGSGGGPSKIFSKPSFQSSLPGTQRHLPDISWLADPVTGGVVAITEMGIYPPQVWEVYGGTSLACPMFSALWAIANQEAGIPLGQAAPYLYSMPAGTITDVLPYSSPTNVTASIQESASQITNYSAARMAAPLGKTTQFYTALWNLPLDQGAAYILTFGTDTNLTTRVGWDNVTGLGTPNGMAFADAFKSKGP